MDDERPANPGFTLPKYVRFARSLALVSGVALGIAAGATVFTTTGCQVCAGTPCNGVSLPPPHDAARADLGAPDVPGADTHEDRPPEPDGGGGGGPMHAPPLPAAWLA